MPRWTDALLVSTLGVNNKGDLDKIFRIKVLPQAGMGRISYCILLSGDVFNAIMDYALLSLVILSVDCMNSVIVIFILCLYWCGLQMF